VGDWYYDEEWNVYDEGYTTCNSVSSVCSGGTAKDYLVHEFVYGDEDGWGTTWGLSYDKYYGSSMTDTDPYVRVPYDLDMYTKTYIKADHDIEFNFTGSATGNIDIQSTGNVSFEGNVYNPSGTTNISSSNLLSFSDESSITSDILTLSAGKGSIGSANQILAINTDELTMSAAKGSLYFNVTGLDGDITIGGLSAKYDIDATFDKGIVAKNDSVVISADTLDIESTSGGIGSIGTLGVESTYDYMNISATGAVNLKAV